MGNDTGMSEQKCITYSVMAWSAQYKAQIRIDGNDAEYKLFEDYREATKWSRERVKELTQQTN